MSAVVVHGDHRIRRDLGKCRRELVCAIAQQVLTGYPLPRSASSESVDEKPGGPEVIVQLWPH